MAALMRAVSTSENSKSWGRIESAGFHAVRSAPFTISRFSCMSFSSSASSASLSCTAQIARIDPTSARCAPRSAWVIYASMRWMRLIASSVNSISPSQYPTRTDRFDATHFYLQKKKTAASGLVSRAPDAKCDQRFSVPQRYNWR
jgi:hypothetical protein